jgi:hypothetical protein
MTRRDVLGRYRHLRSISKHHHHTILTFLAHPTILEHAKHLGMRDRQTVIADSEEELTLVFDLAIHTAREGRSRAIDRYAKAAGLPSDSDDGLVLEAMCRARFSLWRIARRHDICGLVIDDLLRQAETWLVDEGLEKSGAAGMCFASRVYEPDQFAMTSGVIVPVDRPLLEEVLTDGRACRHADPERIADDPRFAAAIYRAAVEAGLMDRVAFC